MKATLGDIYLCRTANMSWRTCVVVKQIQSNQSVSEDRLSPKKTTGRILTPNYWRVYMKDNSWINFIFCIVESHAHQHCHHAWPTLIHGNSGHVAVRAGAREWCLMNRSQNARLWSACSWLLYCSMQRVMFRPCTHMSDHVHMVQSESDMIEYVSLRDWLYVMSRQNNQNVINSWLTLYYMNGAHFHGYTYIANSPDIRYPIITSPSLSDASVHSMAWSTFSN